MNRHDREADGDFQTVTYREWWTDGGEIARERETGVKYNILSLQLHVSEESSMFFFPIRFKVCEPTALSEADPCSIL